MDGWMVFLSIAFFHSPGKSDFMVGLSLVGCARWQVHTQTDRYMYTYRQIDRHRYIHTFIHPTHPIHLPSIQHSIAMVLVWNELGMGEVEKIYCAAIQSIHPIHPSIHLSIQHSIAMVLVWNELAMGDREYCAAIVAVNSILTIALVLTHPSTYLSIYPYIHPIQHRHGVSLE